MPQDIKLFISCHRNDVAIPDIDLVHPIQVGTAFGKARFEGMLHDDEGDNLSAKNKSYCELTGQYWVWKHVDADYYGFLHYRRYFNFSSKTFPEHHEPFIFDDVVFPANDRRALEEIAFDEATIRRVIGSHDFIAPVPVEAPNGATVYEQYRDSVGHHIEDLDTVMGIVEHRYPEIWESAKKYFAQTKSYVCNMFVMKKELFDEYSAFLFDVLEQHERLCDASHYTAVGRRVAGYLGERLCGAYLTYLKDKGYNGCDLQRVYFREQSVASAAPADAKPADGDVKLDTVTRGSGKLYARLATPVDARSVARAVATSRTDEGRALPAKVVESHGGLVLVVPLASVSQSVEVTLLSADGATLCRGSAVIHPGSTTLRARANTLLKRSVVDEIRNCDKEFLPGDTRVVVSDLVPEDDHLSIGGGVTSRLARGFVTYVRPAGSPMEFVELSAVDGAGGNVGMGGWICMGDECAPLPDCPGFEQRTIQFTVRVQPVDSFTVWARFPDGERQDGFFGMESFAAEGMEEAWRRLTCPACDDENYGDWYVRCHRASQAELALQRERGFEGGPVFSVIVPLYKTPTSYLHEMAQSVLGQTYGAWELVLVNASPEDEGLRRDVEALCASDGRIRAVTLEKNLGITENTNAGIAVSTGDFLCFLDHDDVLEPDALFCYARSLEDHPDIDLFYCDEDKLLDGEFVSPFFKPEWNLELLLGMNYVCHFLAVRKRLVDEMPRPDSALDGSQDYNMALAIGERARRVCHVPRVLYHWRIHENSTAQRAEQKSYALESSRLAVQRHLERRGIKAAVRDSQLSPRRFTIDYERDRDPLVSIVIPNKDALRVLHRCLVSLFAKTAYPNFEVVIVENNSTSPEIFSYYEALQRCESRVRVVTVEDMPSFNFSKIVNVGAAAARGEYLLLLNNDTQVISPDWLDVLVGQLMQDGVGITGAKLLFPDDTVQHAGVVFCPDGPWHLGHRMPKYARGNMESLVLRRSVGAVTGACLLISKETFERVGGMDEELSVNYNDIDLCLAVRREGLRVVFCPEAELYHYESVSRGVETSGAKALRFRTEKGRFMEKWPEVFEQGDPYESPHFEKGSIFEGLKKEPDRPEWATEG